jgi:ankyrin repeat protein
MAWMCFAKRPLHVEEIEHAIAIVVESQEFDVDDIVPGRKLVDLCCGLVMMDDSKRFRFVHPTVQDHIKVVLRERLPDVETIVTRKCLTYLQLKHLESGPRTNKEELETRLSNFPLMRHCSWYWARHLQDVQDDQVHALVEKILTDDRYWRSALQTHEYLLLDNIVQTFDFSVLHYVAAVGAIGFLEDLIQQNAQDINATNIKLITPLMLSAYRNHSLCVAELLKLGADPNLQDCRGKTALHLAAEKGNLQTVNVLVSAASIDLNLLDHDGDSALTRAISWEHGDVAERILEAGADINARAGSGYTAIAEAIYHKSQSSIVKALLLRPELDATILSAGMSTLMIAAGYGDLETNKKLLQMPGIDIDAQSADSGQTVLMTAMGNAHIDVALFLLQQEDIKLDIPCKSAAVDNEMTWRGSTALFYAVSLGNDTLFDALLDKGASSDIVTEDFSTPLLIAASTNRGRMVARLIQLREDTGLKQQSGAPHAELCTSSSAASSRCAPHQELSDFRRVELSTALHYAVDWGNLEMASLLLQHGARLDQRDTLNMFTVVEYALYWNNLEILHLFLTAEPENPLLLQRGLAEKKPPNEGRAA